MCGFRFSFRCRSQRFLIGFLRAGSSRPKCGDAPALPSAVIFVLENAARARWFFSGRCRVFSSRKSPRWKSAPVQLCSVLLSIKQYTILAAPVDGDVRKIEERSSTRRSHYISPFSQSSIFRFLWSPRSFMHSTIEVFAKMLRTDSISISAWVMTRFGIRLPMLLTAAIGVFVASGSDLGAAEMSGNFAAAFALRDADRLSLRHVGVRELLLLRRIGAGDLADRIRCCKIGVD